MIPIKKNLQRIAFNTSENKPIIFEINKNE